MPSASAKLSVQVFEDAQATSVQPRIRSGLSCVEKLSGKLSNERLHGRIFGILKILDDIGKGYRRSFVRLIRVLSIYLVAVVELNLLYTIIWKGAWARVVGVTSMISALGIADQ